MAAETSQCCGCPLLKLENDDLGRNYWKMAELRTKSPFVFYLFYVSVSLFLSIYLCADGRLFPAIFPSFSHRGRDANRQWNLEPVFWRRPSRHTRPRLDIKFIDSPHRCALIVRCSISTVDINMHGQLNACVLF